MELTEDERKFFNKQQEQMGVRNEMSLDSIVDNVLQIDKIESTVICLKCSSRDVSYEHRQTRSMDEGMTSFFTCRTCNATWKE